MDIRSEYLALMERQLDEWKSFTERIRSQTDQLEAQARTQFTQGLETLRAKQNDAWDSLMKLKSSGEDAWDQWKTQLDRSWEEMRKSSDKLTDQFRQK